MTSRSRFSKSYRAMLVSSLAVALAAIAACGGKVASSESGPGTSATAPTSCSKNVPTCKANCDDDFGAKPSCIDGSWVCPFPSDHCKPPVLTCDDDGQPDCACGTPRCVSGSWECPRSCVCPDDLESAVGKPCDQEGLSCGGGAACTDECSFCNIFECSGGVWTQLEVFPNPNCGIDGGVVDASIGHD